MKVKKRENKLIHRIGSKDQDIKYFLKYLPEDVETVVEPFGGSFAVCRMVYYDDKYKKHVNDNDPELFYAYNNLHELKEIKEYINEQIDEYGHEKMKLKRHIMDKYEEHPLYNYIINNCFVRGNICKKAPTDQFNKARIDELKKYTFTKHDYKKILKQYQRDAECFLFMDPPYLFSSNEAYYAQNEETDMTDILVQIKKYIEDPKTKCKVMLIINKLKMVEYLFEDNIVGEYSKTYQISKKKTTHLIITNYTNE
jgi:site-specific DNA-adenine methylase